MPRSITKEDAEELRAKVRAYLGPEKRSPKRRELARAFGKSEANFYAFMRGNRGITPESAKRIEAALGDATPAPGAKAAKVKWQDAGRAPEAEKNLLLAEVRAKYPVVAQFMKAAEIPASSSSHWYAVLKGRTPMTELMAERIRGVLAGKPVPVLERGNDHLYVSESEAAQIRTLVEAYIQARFGGVALRFAESLGIRWTSVAVPLRHGGRITHRLARKLRKAIGATEPAPLVHVPTKSKAGALRAARPRVSRDVLARLRLDAGHMLATKCGGSNAALARALGITAASLARFLDGGPLKADEAEGAARRLAEMDGNRRAIATRPASVWETVSVDVAPEPPELRAQKLVQKWGREAIEIVLQLAQGGAA